MLTSFPVSLLIGTLLGFLTGLGTGGGSLLMIWLTLVCQLDPGQAKSINLLFFIPSALCATFLRAKQGGIPWKKLLLPTIAGCISAAAFAWVSHGINTLVLQKIFGALLIYIGLREVLYKEKNGS